MLLKISLACVGQQISHHTVQSQKRRKVSHFFANGKILMPPPSFCSGILEMDSKCSVTCRRCAGVRRPLCLSCREAALSSGLWDGRRPRLRGPPRIRSVAVVRAYRACGDYLRNEMLLAVPISVVKLPFTDVAPGVAVQLALVNVYHDFYVSGTFTGFSLIAVTPRVPLRNWKLRCIRVITFLWDES